MESAENHFLRARKRRVKFFSTCGWAGLGQGETPWKRQVTNLLPCHLEPQPVLSQAQKPSLKFTMCCVRVADLPSSVMGCCFYFPFIEEHELLPVVSRAIKLLQGLRFTYWPRDLQQAHRERKRGCLQSN